MFDGRRRSSETPLVLTVPGLNSSGPGHWQSLWENSRGDCVRAELGMWSRPHRNVWVAKLSHAIAGARRPVVLCAHSLGCLAVAWWAMLEGQHAGGAVAGALLVAPPDCDRRRLPQPLAQFQPAPRISLPFPSIVVASRDDRYASIGYARDLAANWGSDFIDVGALGHINADSRIGHWPFGERLLDLLVNKSGCAQKPARKGCRPDAFRPPAARPNTTYSLVSNERPR